ncbi:hypothetical protein EXIGLDRAFT_832190 [Exidia glandulosa HHB12029]|uniref:Dystroglycan-type cadherin-like domain-containing protein n=1 Tax=Exidia glandulosa HHB12029 TaxID=1314781 RepID=A0A165LVI2_EXIGL|nr:hypothetical protein EXIGLDRAFT_832190 [Exidia glandulosa HHB12029]
MWVLPALIAAAFAPPSLAAPSSTTVARPLQSLLPPVARVDEHFNFTVPKTAFASASDASLIYNVTGLPAWATFDNLTLSFTGTPRPSDVATSLVTLMAASGSAVAQDAFRLVVSSAARPTLHAPLADQLAPSNASTFSNTTAVLSSAFPLPKTPGVRIPPGWSFSLGLDPHSCTSSRSRLYYGATLADGGALPSWLKFSNKTLTFSGATPRSVLVQSFDLRFVCSDVPDSAAVEQRFTVVVAPQSHLLEARAPLQEISAVAYGAVQYGVKAACTDALYVDGMRVAEEEIASLDLDVPESLSWLTWSSDDGILRGQASSGVVEGVTNISIALRSTFNTSTSLTLPVHIYPFLFADHSLPSVQPDASTQVDVTASSLLASAASNLDTLALSVSLDPSEAGSWLTFDNATLSGHVPRDVTYPSVLVTLFAKDASWPDGATSVATFTIDTSSTSTHPPVGSQQPDAGAGDTNGRRKLIIALAVTLPLLALLLLLLCLARRQRRTREKKPDIPAISITASRSWPHLNINLFGAGGRHSMGSDAAKKLSISGGSQISHTSSWLVGTDGHFSVLTPRIGALDGNALPGLGSFEVISLTALGSHSRLTTPKHDTPRTPPPGEGTPRRLALVRALDPEMSDEIKKRRTSEEVRALEEEEEQIVFASPTRSDFDATSDSSTSSFKWTSPSVSLHSRADLDTLNSRSNSGSGSRSGSGSERSLPRPRPDFRPGSRRYLSTRRTQGHGGQDAIGRSQQTIQLPGTAFGSMGDLSDVASDDEDDVSCIRVASLVPVGGTPTPVREVAVQQVHVEGTPDSRDSLDRTLFGLGYPPEALSQVFPGSRDSQPLVDLPSIRLVTPPSSPSPRERDAPQVVRARVGQRFRFHPQLNPPPAMTPSSGRSSPTRARYVPEGDVPAWLRWDEDELAFWGAPGAQDVASTQIQIVERIARRERDVVVGRVLVVVVKD